MTDHQTLILDDLPTDQDALDFAPYANTLVEVCKTAHTPLTVGIFGSWGSGKTSLMQMIRKGLPPDYTVAWFDAWKYDKEETLWRAFLLSVLSAVRTRMAAVDSEQPTEDLDYLESMLYRAIDLERAGGVTIDLARLTGKALQGAVQIGLSFIPGAAALGKLVEELQKLGTGNFTQGTLDAIQRERTQIHIEQVRFLEQFQDKFRILVQNNVHPGRLVVFVDDLDRCLPEKAIQVLEAIKLFVDAPDCVFLLGLDQEVIARGVEIRYKDFVQEGGGPGSNPIDGARYLEKIIQLPFAIPKVEPADMSDFVCGLTADWPHAECPRVFAVGLGDNPRQIKRTVNVFMMLSRLAWERREKLQERIKPIRLAKIVVIQAMAFDLYKLLSEQPGLLRDIEQYYRQESAAKGKGLTEREAEAVRHPTPETKAGSQLPEDLLRLVSATPAVGTILTMHPFDYPEASFHDQTPQDIRLYFTLTRRVEAPQPTLTETPSLIFEPQMVNIPAGEFLMGSTPEQVKQTIKDGADERWLEWEQPQHPVELSAYAIGKYPVTCREYQLFLQEKPGYSAPPGWSGSQHPDGKADHPLVNVSWEDAVQYCQWLSDKTKKPYRLPSEAEWEKAARGTDGRIYPWGNTFEPQKANTEEAKVGDTTPVGQYSPQGDSPYGCADMVGNVWEWCADWFNPDEYKKHSEEVTKNPTGPTKGRERVLRGGTFYNSRRFARCTGRSGRLPLSRDRYFGFRVVLAPIF